MTSFNEYTVEAATLTWLAEIGWQVAHFHDPRIRNLDQRIRSRDANAPSATIRFLSMALRCSG